MCFCKYNNNNTNQLHLLRALILQKLGLFKLDLRSQDGLDRDNALVLVKHVPYGLKWYIMFGASAHVQRHIETRIF